MPESGWKFFEPFAMAGSKLILFAKQKKNIKIFTATKKPLAVATTLSKLSNLQQTSKRREIRSTRLPSQVEVLLSVPLLALGFQLLNFFLPRALRSELLLNCDGDDGGGCPRYSCYGAGLRGTENDSIFSTMYLFQYYW